MKEDFNLIKKIEKFLMFLSLRKTVLIFVSILLFIILVVSNLVLLNFALLPSILSSLALILLFNVYSLTKCEVELPSFLFFAFMWSQLCGFTVWVIVGLVINVRESSILLFLLMSAIASYSMFFCYRYLDRHKSIKFDFSKTINKIKIHSVRKGYKRTYKQEYLSKKVLNTLLENEKKLTLSTIMSPEFIKLVDDEDLIKFSQLSESYESLNRKGSNFYDSYTSLNEIYSVLTDEVWSRKTKEDEVDYEDIAYSKANTDAVALAQELLMD